MIFLTEQEDEGAQLVVSMFDNYFGKRLSTFVLEEDVSPADRDFLSLAFVTHDSLVYTRLRPNDNRLQYTILRLNRKYGGKISCGPLEIEPAVPP